MPRAVRLAQDLLATGKAPAAHAADRSAPLTVPDDGPLPAVSLRG